MPRRPALDVPLPLALSLVVVVVLVLAVVLALALVAPLAACPGRDAGVPLGERCSKLAECAPGADACQELDGQRFCTRGCERGCPDGFECRRLPQIGESQLSSRPICIPRRRLAAPRHP